MPGEFFDSNVLLYLVSGDARKADIAERLVRRGGTVSVQVLNEFASAGRRKMGMDWGRLRPLLASLVELFSIEPLTLQLHQRAVDVAERYKISVYDACIVSAALTADCSVLWSEDMQQGMEFEKRLRVVNPFAGPGVP